MTLTAAEIVDLMPGDEVEIRHPSFPEVITHGPLHESNGRLMLGNLIIRWGADGRGSVETVGMRVVSRAPRRPYVNHEKVEPQNGDVVRNADDPTDTRVWLYASEGEEDEHPWCRGTGGKDSQVWWRREDLPVRLLLLVDGPHGEVVRS